uniref:BTB domain-containing protein n=1 Tax=Anopheles farauti TaxID=69004 RepID=A0A182QIE5_9DIPT
MSNQQAFSLRWNDYSTYIGGAFDSLRYEEDLVDVTLYCEGRRIRAHKMLLSACSSYFKDIFKENPCQHPVIIFKNVRHSDLVSLVEFMYRGEVNVLQDSLQSFLRTAEMLSVRGLAETGITDPQQMHSAVSAHPTSTLAQQILQTQSQNMNSATITTPQSVFITLPTSSPMVSQVKVEPEQIQPSVIPQTNQLLQQQQQQQQQRHSQTFSQPQSTPVQQILSTSQAPLQQQHRFQLKSGHTIAITTIGQRLGMENSPSQLDVNNQPSTALQDLVDSVVSSAQMNRVKHMPNQKETLTSTPTARIVPVAASASFTAEEIETTTGGQSNDAMEMHQQTTQDHEQDATYAELQNADMKLHMTEYINVNDGITTTTTTTTTVDTATATTSGDSGSYTQLESYELACDELPEPSDSDDPIEEGSFEMETDNLGVNGMFPVDEQPKEPKPKATGSTVPGEKKFKCRECDKSFCTWKSLNMHRHIHSGRTECKICGAILSRTANLKRHMKLKHEP